MHLHKDLRLKKVEILKDLPRIISEVCDEYIKQENDVPQDAELSYEQAWEQSKKAKISNEDGLVKAYRILVPTFQSAASTLRFGTSWDEPALLWSAEPVAFYPGRKEAVADGFLSTPTNLHKLSGSSEKRWTFWTNIVSTILVFGNSKVWSVAQRS